MRHDAQKTIAFQDLLPADAALRGFRSNVGGESFMRALRDWEKRRGILPVNIPRAKQAAPKPPARPPKKTREELLARKRERARQRWAQMSPEQKQAEMKRIHAWRAAKKEARA